MTTDNRVHGPFIQYRQWRRREPPVLFRCSCPFQSWPSLGFTREQQLHLHLRPRRNSGLCGRSRAESLDETCAAVPTSFPSRTAPAFIWPTAGHVGPQACKTFEIERIFEACQLTWTWKWRSGRTITKQQFQISETNNSYFRIQIWLLTVTTELTSERGSVYKSNNSEHGLTHISGQIRCKTPDI